MNLYCLSRSDAAIAGYDEVIDVIAQSYGHIPQINARKIAKLEAAKRELRRTKGQVVVRARKASREMLQEVIEAAEQGRFKEAAEFMGVVNELRPFANLRPIALDEVATIDHLRPAPPSIDFPSSKTQNKKKNKGKKGHTKRGQLRHPTGSTARPGVGRLVREIPPGTPLRLAPRQDDQAMTSHRHLSGRHGNRDGGGKEDDDGKDFESAHKPISNFSTFFRLSYDGVPARGDNSKYGPESLDPPVDMWQQWPENDDLVLQRPGRVVLELQYRPSSVSVGLSSVPQVYQFTVAAPRRTRK